MANPRKFSEKIALHTQKQAEETAAFEAIIREVTATTRQATAAMKQPQPQPAQQHHLRLSQPNLNGASRGRSLPNVNQMSNCTGIDLQDALSSLENMKQAVDSGHTITDRPHRDRSPQSQKKYFLDRHRDCSPYGSVYLCPPSDGNWRRASSDSALHSSVMGTTAQNLSGTGSMILSNGPTVENGQLVISSGVVGMDFSQSLDTKTMSDLLRPKSCEVPGINIFPSPESAGAPTIAPSIVHVPIPNSTGSLPNLTNLSFSLPLTMPIDIDPVCCGPGGIPPNYTVAGSQCSSGGGTMPVRLHRHTVPVPLVLHSAGQFMLSGNGPASEGKLLTANNDLGSSNTTGARGTMSAEPPSYMNHIHNNGLRGSLSPPMIVITSDAPAQRIHTGRYSEPLSERADGLMDPLMECDEPITISGSRRNHRNHSGRSCTPPPVFRHQNGGVLRPQAFDNRRQEAVHDAEDEIIRRHRVENLAQYSMVNNAAAAAGGTVQSPMSPLRSSPHHGSLVSPADACASTHVLYTVAQRSPQDSSLMSPGATGDLSPRSVSAHLSPGGAVSPQWFSQSSSPPSPSSRQRDAVAASGELSPAHASALQQRFQQFNMLPEEQLVARPGGASGGVGLYSLTAQPVQLQSQQQHQTLPVTPQQHHQTITVPPTGLVLVPATQQTNAAGASFLWQVSPSSFSPSLAAPCSQASLPPTENPGFFRVAAGGLSAALETACNQATAFGSSFANATAPHIATTAIHILPDYVGQHSPEPMVSDLSPLPASSSIPDIVLTAEDLPVYSNQPLADNLNQQDLTSAGGINPLSYLGDSFDASTDLFTAEDALKLGLDPLEIEELQMLADASIVADPATEDSFRLDRQ